MTEEQRREEFQKLNTDAQSDEEMYSIEMASAAALPGWIAVLGARNKEPGYSDEGAAIEAARLAIMSGNALIELTKSFKEGGTKS